MKHSVSSAIAQIILSAVPLLAFATDENPVVDTYGDFTLRLEDDYGGKLTGQRDRERVRMIIRAAINVTLNDSNQFTIGARTGDLDNHLVPAITLYRFDDNSLGNRDAYVDRWYWSYKGEKLEFTAGRFNWPFWASTERIWDKDAHPSGGSVRYKIDEKNKHSLTGIFATAPDGALGFHGRIAGLQYQWRPENTWRAALNVFHYNGEGGAEHLENADVDYLLTQMSVQWRGELAKQPLSFGMDLIRNLENSQFRSDDPRALLQDERNALSLEASWGQNKQPGDWRLRYQFAYIEAFAIVPDYGPNPQSRFATTDIRIHDTRLSYSLSKNWTAQARYSYSEGITNGKRANRARLEFTLKF